MLGTNVVKIQESEEMKGIHALIMLLKEKFAKAENTRDKIRVLSVLPPTWSLSKIFEEFGPLGASEYIIRKTKKLVKIHGVLHTRDPKPGRPLNDETVQLVKRFYELDEISSKQMPGCKDYVTVYENSVKVQKQKRMLLSNLESLHIEYNNIHGETNPVGFSKFAQLRPKHCVLCVYLQVQQGLILCVSVCTMKI